MREPKSLINSYLFYQEDGKRGASPSKDDPMPVVASSRSICRCCAADELPVAEIRASQTLRFNVCAFLNQEKF